MAEFASAIIGVVAFAAQTCDALQTIVATVKDAPSEYDDLIHQVSDFRNVLRKVLEEQKANRLRDGDLGTIISHAEHRLKEVASLVAKLQKDRGSAGPGNEGQRVSRLKWVLRSKNVIRIQASLERHKLSINNMLALATMESVTAMRIQVKAVQAKLNAVVFEQRSPDQNSGKASQLRLLTIADAHHAPSPSVAVPKRASTFPAKLIYSKVESHEIKLARSGSDLARVLEDGLLTPSGSQGRNAHATISGNISLTRRDSDQVVARRPRVRGRLKIAKASALQCLDDCSCTCHKRVLYRSPRRLSTFMGDAFLGMSNLPWMLSSFAQCNEQTCRRSQQISADFRYRLPSWFLSAYASFSMNFAVRFIPLQIFLSTRNVIPYDSPILVCIQEGDLNTAKNLLFSGRASLNDVDPYGLGLLYYASYYCWRSRGSTTAIDATRNLIDMGAHAEWEDEIGNTALETMVDAVLTTSAKKTSTASGLQTAVMQEIALLFGKTSEELMEDYTEDRTFSPLHEVLLGLDTSKGSLDEYLSTFGLQRIDADIIDIQDACGRTPLAWAVEYGWVSAVKTLLKYGADPHQLRPSVHGRSPLLHLVIAGPASQSGDTSYLEVVKLLLMAGVGVNVIDHEGWTPLHVAASWNLADVITELADHAGGGLDWDCKTHKGETAIDLSLNGGGDEEVLYLLESRGKGCTGSITTCENVSEDEFFDALDDTP